MKGADLLSITTEFSLKGKTVKMDFKSTAYDNERGVSENTQLTTVLSSGFLVIHPAN